MNRLGEIEQRKLEIRNLLQSDNEIDLATIESELRVLETEANELQQRAKIAQGINNGTIAATVIPNPEHQQRGVLHMDKEQILASAEYRAAYLKNLQGKRLTDVEERVLTTGAGSAGSAVPTQTLNLIIDKLRQTSALYPRISVSFVPSNLSMVVANAKNAAAWKAEGTDGTPADDTVTNVNLTGYELIKLVEISAAAQAMTIDAFETYIASEIGRQMSIAVENAILNGDGTGEPTGILTGITWGATNNVTWTTSVSYDEFADGLALLPTLYHNNAIFVMNRKLLFDGLRKIKATDGQPIFTYNPQDRAAMTVLGYPVVIDDYIPDDTILLGDFSYYYMNFVQAPTIDSSREAGFKSGKITYRGLAIADGKPALAEAFVKINKA